MNKSFAEKDIKNMYNLEVKKQSKGNYEHYRWMSTPDAKIDYMMTYEAIYLQIKQLNFKKVIELGPGPGTWTKLLIEENPKARFLLVDISREMIRQAKKNLPKKNIVFKESNFLDVPIKEKFGLFFSSRAIEYIPDKVAAIDKIYNLLNEKGIGIIITKQPHPVKMIFRRMLGKKISAEHMEKISPRSFKKLLLKRGFKDISVYPVLMPPKMLFIPRKLRIFIFKRFYRNRLSLFTKFLSESYLIKFRK